MRSKLLYAIPALLSVAFFAPQFAHATIPFLGPIIPPALQTCPASYAGLITVVNNLLQFGITLIIVFVAPLMIAYGGFLYLTSPFNSAQLSKAKDILRHAVVGIILSLSAWLIITAVLAFITPNGELFGKKWTTLLVSSSLDPCLRLNQGGRGSFSSPGVVVAPTPTLPVSRSGTYAPSMSSASAQTAAQAVSSAYRSKVCEEAQNQGIPGECAHLLGMIGVESGGNPNAVSSHGATGLMQLMPTTAARYGVSECQGSSDASPSASCVAALKDPNRNMSAGVAYYASLYNKFGGDQTNATAAYNAGDSKTTSVSGLRGPFAPSQDCPGSYAWQCTVNAGGFTQTQNYVANVNLVAGYIK